MVIYGKVASQIESSRFTPIVTQIRVRLVLVGSSAVLELTYNIEFPLAKSLVLALRFRMPHLSLSKLALVLRLSIEARLFVAT